MPNLTGQSIGRYHILEQLGEGGMAIVYKAYDTRLERNVALKVLRTDLFGQAVLEQVLKRFEREAKSLAKLSHSSIVNILDYGEHEGNPYLVMEYLPGGTLKQKLGQAIPWQEAIHTLLPVARGLSYAHQRGIIHRDVKPANILIDENEEPILTDFGIAKLLEGVDGHTLTGSGVGIGTPEYMAPEQGIGASTIDARADIYSLGIVLFEMITGRKPYIADTPMAVVLKQMTDPLPRPTDFVPDLPEGVEHILFKALAKQPDDRYADMDTLIAAMEGVLSEAQKIEVQVSSKRLKEKITWGAKPSPKVVVAVIGVLAIISIFVFGMPWVSRLLSAMPAAEAAVTKVSEAPSATITMVPLTSTLEPSPLPTLTRTIRPTATNPPAPSWVTDFAEPILSAISRRVPNFQDDFSTGEGGWKVGGVCEFTGHRPLYKNGEMTIDPGGSCWVWRDMWYPHFVAEVDARFLSGASDNSGWDFKYRHVGDGEDSWSNGYKFRFDGSVAATLAGPNASRDNLEHINIPGAALPGTNTNHILIIAKDQTVTLYINDKPIFYKVGEPVWANGGFRLDIDDKVALDNLKIWDISDLKIP
ncbi:MAG TPA: protein kinase [Anaerolineales bacterium]